MSSRYYRLPVASLLYLCLGCFWIRHDFLNAGSWMLGVSMLGLGAAVGGLLQERLDSAQVGIAGAALFGSGFFATGFLPSPAWNYLTLEVLIGFGSGLAYSAGIPLVVRWFPDKVGTAIGVAVAGYVPASFVGGGVAAVLIGKMGWPGAAKVTGIVLFAVTALAIIVLRGDKDVRRAESSRQHKPDEMVKSTLFPPLLASYVLTCTAAMIVYHTLPEHLTRLNDDPQRTTAVIASLGAVGAAANLLARLLAGWSCDVLGARTPLLVAITILPVAALLALAPWPVEALLVVQFAAFAAYGAALAIFPVLTAHLFGVEHLAANYGIVFNGWAIGHIAGGIAGPLLARTFGTSDAFYGAAVVSLVALLLVVRTGRLVQPVLRVA